MFRLYNLIIISGVGGFIRVLVTLFLGVNGSSKFYPLLGIITLILALAHVLLIGYKFLKFRGNKMKKLILALALLVIFVSPVLAHPAAKIDLKITGNQVEIVVTHLVNKPAVHYINKIALSLNGQLVVEQKFSEQVGKVFQKAVYLIPGLKAGDNLEVKAYCNKFGDKKKKVTVK